MPPTASARKRWIIILLIAFFIIAGSGTAIIIYNQTRPVFPVPKITLSSMYHVGTTPAGATTTTLSIEGQKFSSTSAITFLLDGHNIPGAPRVKSNAQGGFRTALTVTVSWIPGKHTITARDAGNYITKQGIVVIIVALGQAGTPGPNGAPTDSATFLLNIRIETQSSSEIPNAVILAIMGDPDLASGTVCSEVTGSSFTFNGHFDPNTGQLPGNPFTETLTTTCSGTYMAGKITYTEMTTNDEIVTDYQGVTFTCHLPNHIRLHIEGSFSTPDSVNGTFRSDYIPMQTCTSPDPNFNLQFERPGIQGNWTGTKV